MHRVLELVSATRTAHQSDTFFAGLEQSLATRSLKRRFYAAYERAFAKLDEESWGNLKSKAVAHFHESRPHQLKGPFFDQLNDAFAYCWLLGQHFQHVKVLREQNGSHQSKQPDIAYQHQGVGYFCDTKTINTSANELQNRNVIAYRDSSRYAVLHPTLLKKYDDAIENGKEQINAIGEHGLVFVVVWLDDFTMTYAAAHQHSIRTHLRKQAFPVVVQFGLGPPSIEHIRHLARPRAAQPISEAKI
jgi:hypothetical protein